LKTNENEIKCLFPDQEIQKNFPELVANLTLNPPHKLLSAKILICLNFRSASLLLKVGENNVWL